jgi:hypothetical protein
LIKFTHLPLILLDINLMEKWLASGSLKRQSGDHGKKVNDEPGGTLQTKVRKYDRSYSSFGMTVSVEGFTECPVCCIL